MAGMINIPAEDEEAAGGHEAEEAAEPKTERDAEPESEGGGAFKRPDIGPSIPPEQQDAVARIVAAGMKVMYSPEMREQIMQVVQSQDPIPKKLAESVVGLLLVLDKKAGGKTPVDALPWAAMELLGEAADILAAAKQPVSQEDYSAAATLTVWLMARKMGASDEQVIGSLKQLGQGKAAAPGAAPAAGAPMQGGA